MTGSRRFLARLLVLTAASIGLFVAVLVLVPYHDDEFVHYHIVGCWFFPASDVGDGACHRMDLNLFGTSLTVPLRVYDYIGSFPVLYYLPFYSAFRSPIASRAVGLVFLILGAYVLSRIHRVDFFMLATLLVLLFPYAYQHIVDSGPVSFSIFSLYLLHLLADRWRRDPAAWKLYAASLVIFAGFWTKLTYAWYLPALAALAICTFRGATSSPVSLARHLAGPAALLVLLLSVLFLATSPQDASSRPYFEQLLRSDPYSFGDILAGRWFYSDIMKALVNPLEATQRSFLVGAPALFERSYSVLLYLGPVLLTSSVWRLSRSEEARHLLRNGLIAYALFLLTVLLMLSSKRAWSMHHLVLAYPLLVSSYLFLYRALRLVAGGAQPALRGAALVIGLLLLTSTGFFLLRVSQQTVRDYDHPSKMRLNALLGDSALADHYYYVVLDWGMRFYQALYGTAGQAVLWQPFLSDEEIARLHGLPGRPPRRLLLIHREGNIVARRVRKSLPMETCCVAAPCTGWMVTAEPSAWLEEAFPFCSGPDASPERVSPGAAKAGP